jgi:predicted negative regulator of RcsB-dependent stress response
VDRLTRKELKTDKFALEVGHSVEYVAEHRQQMIRYGAIALVAVVAILGIYGFMSYRKTTRQAALREALRVEEAAVGPDQPESWLSFPTQDAKEKAMQKALTDVATKYDGTDEGAVAHYYLGTFNADKGNVAEADKQFKAVADSGNKSYASLAKLALADIYKSEGKQADGEKLLRSVVDQPTIFVSKEMATIALAKYMASYNPAEAKKLLEPLRGETRPAVSTLALRTLGELQTAVGK